MNSQPTLINFFTGITGNDPAKELQNRQRRFEIRKKLTAEQKQRYCQFDYEYFDSEIGYGGYYYDGRYSLATKRMIDYYQLEQGNRVLDVGCAKGFLVYEFQKSLGKENQDTIFGCDISSYALKQCKEEVKELLFQMSAHQLNFPDHHFDLVVSVDTIHNLPPEQAKTAIREIMRVSRGKCFIQITSYSTPVEAELLRFWGLAVKTFWDTSQWLECFEEIGYTGEYWFKIMRF